MRRRGKWLLPPRPAISGGILLKARKTRKKQPWTRLRRVSRVKVFVCVRIRVYTYAWRWWRKEGDVGQFSRARSTYRQAARNNLSGDRCHLAENRAA